MNDPPAEIEALANQVFGLMARVLEAAGLEPTDPVVGTILATMIGAHYAMCGGGAELRHDIVVEIVRACELADARGRSG